MSRNKFDYNERMPRFGDYRGQHSTGNSGNIGNGIGSGSAPMFRRPRRSNSEYSQQVDYAGQKALNNILAYFPSDSGSDGGAQRHRYPPSGRGTHQQYPMPPSPPLSGPQPGLSASRSGVASRQAMPMRKDDMSSSSEDSMREFEKALQQEKQQYRKQQLQQQQSRQVFQSRSDAGPNSQRSRRNMDTSYQQSVPEEQLGPQSIPPPLVQDSRHHPKETAYPDRRTMRNGRMGGMDDKRSFDGHYSRQRYRRPREIANYSDSAGASSPATSRCSSGPEGNEMDSGYAKELLASRPNIGSTSMPRRAGNRGERRRQRKSCAAFSGDGDMVDDSRGHLDRSRRSQQPYRAPPGFRGDHRPAPLSPPSVSFIPGMEGGNSRRRVVDDFPKDSDGFSSSSASVPAAPPGNNQQRFAGWRETGRSKKTVLTCPHVELVLLSRTYQCDRCDGCRQRPMDAIPSAARPHREILPVSAKTYLTELSDSDGGEIWTSRNQQHHMHQHRDRQPRQEQLQPPQHLQRSRHWKRQMPQNEDLYDPGLTGGLSDGDSCPASWKSRRETRTRANTRQQQPVADYQRQEVPRRRGQPNHHHFDGGSRRSFKRSA